MNLKFTNNLTELNRQNTTPSRHTNHKYPTLSHASLAPTFASGVFSLLPAYGLCRYACLGCVRSLCLQTLVCYTATVRLALLARPSLKLPACHIVPRTNPGCATVRRITAVAIMAPSSIMKETWLFARLPLKPPLSSATRNEHRISIATVETASAMQ